MSLKNEKGMRQKQKDHIERTLTNQREMVAGDGTWEKGDMAN